MLNPLFEPHRVLELLQKCPRYRPTPLMEAPLLAERLSLSSVLVKDESQRMGLGSFKALGGAYAVCRLVTEKTPGPTVCCASAGNHGLSVAAGAQVFGANAIVVLAHTVPMAFQTRLEQLGAKVKREGANYEESVLWAREASSENDWQFLADSSWADYLEVPRLVMEGYTVIGEELQSSLNQQRSWPTHIFLQAGVGGLAGSLTWQIRNSWPEQPQITVVEPDQAACLKASQQNGRCLTVSGGPSNMGRLDCKEPSLLAFQILQHGADRFETVTDSEAAEATALFKEAGFSTTPSGAAGLAACLKMRFSPPGDAKVLLILSEGLPQV